MKKLAGIGVVILVAFGFKFYNRGTDSKQVLADMKEVISKVGLSAEDTTYVNGILEREHQRAFDAAYDMGGRRRSATLDEDKYIEAVFKAIITRCNADKKKQLAERLRGVQQMLLSASDE